MSPIILAALLHAAPAQTYPNVCDLTAFTQPANYMSLTGAMLLRYQASGRWVSREEARRAVEGYLAACPTPAPTGATGPAAFTRSTNFMSRRGFERLQRLPTARARP